MRSADGKQLTACRFYLISGCSPQPAQASPRGCCLLLGPLLGSSPSRAGLLLPWPLPLLVA